MKNADKNRCPERARKRAASDLRCAARKLGLQRAQDILCEMSVHVDKIYARDDLKRGDWVTNGTSFGEFVGTTTTGTQWVCWKSDGSFAAMCERFDDLMAKALARRA